ncbi:hypothetical protein Glove_199g14 [Diversispora epigaea]|uniref:Protein kinase domain-containing protein n=1 Tax=Diversispora epigaea TaxID=1348612 RepID=A0A397IJX6_9GLOM|nr:hypothetical protein Glove_199g14 [Diversispora epigaea]
MDKNNNNNNKDNSDEYFNDNMMVMNLYDDNDDNERNNGDNNNNEILLTNAWYCIMDYILKAEIICVMEISFKSLIASLNYLYLYVQKEGIEEDKEIKEFGEMKETRKTEEMKEMGETEELEESEDYPGKCSKCHQDNTGRNWCHLSILENVANVIKIILEEIGAIYVMPNDFKINLINRQVEIDKFKQQIQLNNGKQDVCLKSLSNSINKNDFLQEANISYKNSIAIYFITKNPTENEYMMVMNYAGYGSLRKVLNNKFKSQLGGMGLMHKDFHPGNIVSCYITDFGLCKPVSEKDSENIFGIIPYMAPETLNKICLIRRFDRNRRFLNRKTL